MSKRGRAAFIGNPRRKNSTPRGGETLAIAVLFEGPYYTRGYFKRRGFFFSVFFFFLRFFFLFFTLIVAPSQHFTPRNGCGQGKP